ncbi:phosphate ABC transporter substrate-binding protein PstS [Pyrobaculum sp.]|uniref:phosphate ABC transporter substrate-binding protein PstS n=1 Tax=Pyrobaculum sp. TaxID=2004705 RepID=UPI0031793EC6
MAKQSIKPNRTILVVFAVIIAVVAAVIIAGTAGGKSSPTSPTQTSPAQSSSPSPTQPSVQPSLKGSITGGGSTFINPQLVAWSRRFYEATKGAVQVNYQSIGSGAGTAQFLEKKLDFGASDVPMPSDKFKDVKGRVVQFPVIIGSIVIAYNVPEVAYEKTGKYLNFTSELLALIYMGEVKQWCDPRIKAVNPGLADKLPCRDIVAVHRSDGSGTTAAFTLYLSKTYQPWNSTVGWGFTVKWPADEKAKGVGAKGNEGVAQAVIQNQYSVGYVEYAYWAKNRDKYDKVGGVAYIRNDNDRRYYFPSADVVMQGAAAGLERYKNKYGSPPAPDADWNPVSVELSNPPTGYPLLSFTYVYLWKDYAGEGYPDAATRAALLREFFRWVLTEGQRPENVVKGYIPLPAELAQMGLKALDQVKP